MKKNVYLSLLIGLSGLTASYAQAEVNFEKQCIVSKLVDGEVFEESLNVAGLMDSEERGQVSLSVYQENAEIFIGESFYTTEEDSSQIEFNEKAKSKEILIIDNEFKYKIIVYNESQKGVILYKYDRPQFSVVAEIDCNDYQSLKRAIRRGEVEEKRISSKAIPKDTLDLINQIDVPFEMADGYYGVKYERHFELKIGGKVVAYRLDSYLSYTEGEDTMASTYFLPSGVRISGPRED